MLDGGAREARGAPEPARTLAGRPRAGRSAGTWGLLFNPRGGAPGWLAFPYMLFFEFFGPLIEAAGYAFIFIAFFAGALQLKAFLSFLGVAVGFGLLLSMSAILLEELSFHVYTKPRHLFMLFAAAIVENFGLPPAKLLLASCGAYKVGARLRDKVGRDEAEGHVAEGVARGNPFK